MAMLPEEIEKIGDLYKAALEAKRELEAYGKTLGDKYASFASGKDVYVQFEDNQAIIFEPQLIFRAH